MSLVAAMGTLATANGALVGHWEFDNSGGVGDATVSTSLGTVGNAAYSASGKIGGALALGGSVGDYLGSSTLPSGLPTGDASFTIALFMQTTVSATQSFTFWGNAASAQANGFRTEGNGALMHWSYAVDYQESTPVTLNDGEWHHVAATYDSASSTKRLYFDGVELGSGKVIGDLNVAALDFRIGSSPYNGFNGLLDDVRVYSDAQSASQIAALAAVPEPSTTALLGLGGLALILRRRK